jgi:DNA-binding response OmpR family regulator
MDPVLVVDDDPDVRTALEMVLKAEDCPVVAVGSGREGMAWLSLNKPSVILLDWNLPDFDGNVFAASLEEAYGRSVPVVLVTGEEHKVNEKALAIRAFGYLQKPFDIDVLCSMIQRALIAPAPVNPN